MKKLIILICFGLIVGCSNNIEPDQKDIIVSGIVVDDSTSLPIDSATVSIRTSYYSPPSSFGYKTICSATTNNYGIYRLSTEVEKDKQYLLCVGKLGYNSIYQFSLNKIVLSYEQYQTINIRLKRN